MSTLSVTEARANLYRVIDETAESHEPVLKFGHSSDCFRKKYQSDRCGIYFKHCGKWVITN